MGTTKDLVKGVIFSTTLAVIIHVVTLEDEVNPVLPAIILDGMPTLIIHFNDATDR